MLLVSVVVFVDLQRATKHYAFILARPHRKQVVRGQRSLILRSDAGMCESACVLL